MTWFVEGDFSIKQNTPCIIVPLNKTKLTTHLQTHEFHYSGTKFAIGYSIPGTIPFDTNHNNLLATKRLLQTEIITIIYSGTMVLLPVYIEYSVLGKDPYFSWNSFK